NSRGNGADTNSGARQLTRQRERHADDATLGGGIGGLADLSFIRSHGSRGDDDAASTVFIGLIGGHGIGGVANRIKNPHQVDLDGSDELSQVMKSILADQLFRDTDSGGGYQEMKSTLLFDNALDGGRHLGRVSDISLDERDVASELLGQFFAGLFIDVSNCD